MSADSSSAADHTHDPRLPVRALDLLRVRTAWVIPVVVASVVVIVMTAFYLSSVVNPLAHLRGLPVAVVNQDRGALIGSEHLQIGQQLQSGLIESSALSSRLHLTVSTLPQAERAMNRDALYATLVIPGDFSATLLELSGLDSTNTISPVPPQVEILTNERAGTVGASLATEILEPALVVASHQIGQHLSSLVPTNAEVASTTVFLANPVTVKTAQYRPLPANTALGVSDFYVALLTMLCGFLGGTIVNSFVDSVLGYTTNDIGPHWRMRKPVAITRWQTLMIKWAIVPVVTGVAIGLMLAIAAGALGMDAPYPALLWLYAWLCAASVGIGVIVLFAVAGSYGQLIGLLLFVYAGLASAGGTVPLQALPAFNRLLSNFEPLRQILAGTRSILYFGARGDAGLIRGTLFAGFGLIFWLAIGTTIVRWYDRKGLYRLHPDLLDHVSNSVERFRVRQTDPARPVKSTGDLG